MTAMARRADAAGFTLLELIVAVSILALIAVFSWRGLDALIREREALASSQAAIDAVQRLFARVERDALAASDVQVDESGHLQFVAGIAALDGGAAASVAYRLADGALLRTVVGVDREPQAVIGDLSSWTVEAWLPSPRGGAWTRTKTNLQEAAPLTGPPSATNAATTAATTAAATAPAQLPAPTATSPQPAPVAPSNGSVTGPATGVRLSFTRAGGPPIVRTFLIGGG